MTSKQDYIRSDAASLSNAAQRGLLHLPRRLDFLVESLPPPPARILDVGCAGGYVATLLMKLGYEVTGIELNTRMAEQARQRGIDVLEHDLEEPVPLPDGRFDGVHACEIIEHLFDTDGFLAELGRLLRPGGVLVASTPNLNSLGNRLRVLAGRSLPMWGAGPQDRHGGHIRVLNKPSFGDLLARNGFRPTGYLGSNQGRLGRLVDPFPALSQLILVRAVAGGRDREAPERDGASG
ncbi:class I SAM-dependent methyltransferase [Haloechinothrix sp. LS1_15]|uniref:class I SAM-dependent methyltransferase n=1 Tax=Haloechinothrix sp. LS1_15 TaxID=2652248 RepID=UPI00294B3EC8|nr:class I SAM-dependent methyltransferase [Haloechinothrix sp. LS1_15]